MLNQLELLRNQSICVPKIRNTIFSAHQKVFSLLRKKQQNFLPLTKFSVLKVKSYKKVNALTSAPIVARNMHLEEKFDPQWIKVGSTFSIIHIMLQN